MRHTISVLVQNEAGALSRISDMFSSRGYNIEALTVAPTFEGDYSKVTIVTVGEDREIEQIIKQLHKIIPIVKVTKMEAANTIQHELMFIKVLVKDESRSELIRIAELFGAKILDISQKYYTLQAVGDDRQINSLIDLLRPMGIKDLVRSGCVAIARG